MERVGIVGGGIGGLAVAWNLYYQYIGAGLTPDINVFEASGRFGGNADTKHFSFGKGPGNETEPLLRWADMGVNDFNIPAYRKIVEVMKEIKYTKENGNYRTLEDSTTYYDTKGNAFTANSTKSGAQDPWWDTAMPKTLSDTVQEFMTIAGADLNDKKTAKHYHDYTLKRYIDEKMQDNPHWDKRLGTDVIYPRVNGMYFTSSITGPTEMPWAAVMHYYHIQEGIGSGKADRNYFVGGSSTWIDALVKYMEKLPGMTLHLDRKVTVTPNPDETGYDVTNQTSDGKYESLFCRYVCLATPADNALQLMKSYYLAVENKTGTEGLPRAAASILAAVKYETAISVAHTDSRLMPVNRNAWSTYNIVKHEPDAVGLKPYVINYVANRHQNDAANETFNKFGSPEFFLSINPHIPISKDKVLVDTNGEPAIANLKHFVFDFDCMQAQTDIKAQQGKAGIYYASGWTAGSGLHIECWQQGIDVAEMIMKSVRAGKEVVEEQTQTRDEYIMSRLLVAGSHD